MTGSPSPEFPTQPIPADLDLARREVVDRLLRQHQVRPDKRLGQNFLVDAAALRRIVEAAELSGDDTVLEIGAGLGTLTQRLAAEVRRVVAVEYDRRLEPILRSVVGHDSRVEIVIDDILRLDLGRWMRGEDYVVVANIPYQITSHLIRLLLESAVAPRRTVLTVQRELAERAVAGPGEMSLLALGVQAYGAARRMGTIPPGAFVPSPRVESAILRIDVHRPARLTPAQTKDVFRLARAGFSQPRKKLRNAMAGGLRLSPQDVERRLRRAGVSPDARAEDLSLEEWTALAEGWGEADLSRADRGT